MIVQGKCDNAAKVTGELKKNGQVIDGGTKLTNNAKQWGFRYTELAVGNYDFKVEQTNSPVETQDTSFEILSLPPPPPPQTPPSVTYPADGDEVGVIFYPYGTSATNITEVRFFDGTHSVNGNVTQQPDANGEWTAEVSGIDSWPNGPQNRYQLRVTNNGGNLSTTINNLTIATP
jgi:hypothetical protein